MRYLTSILLIFSLFLFCAWQKNTATGTATIRLSPQFTGKPLVLEKQLYTTASGDSLYLDLCRFYLTGIKLHGVGDVYAEKESYHLVDAENDGSFSIVLKDVPVDQYNALSFNLGTDSLTNVSGAMGGDLDPTLGMYWAWNTGYVNLKMEGRSNSCKTNYHGFEFHIGGYMPPYPTLRRVKLELRNFRVLANKPATINVRVDLSNFFRNFKLETINQVMIPSAQAAQLADFFKQVFSIF